MISEEPQNLIIPKGEVNGENKIFKLPINVSGRLFTWSGNLVRNPDGTWSPAKPLLYTPNLFEKIKHALGKHWSYGQSFCVICGKEKI
jgi:hypothetical protein